MQVWVKNLPVPGFTFGLVDSADGSYVTSADVIGYISKNGGDQAVLENTPVHKGNGMWSVDLTAEEMNAEIVGLCFISEKTVPCYFTIKTASGGINIATIIITDGNTVLPGVDVYVYNATNTVYINNAITDANGKVQFYLGNEVYHVRLNKSGYTFDSQNSFTVNGDTETTFAAIEINYAGVPDDPGACRVYGYCFDQSGQNPLESVNASAKIRAIPNEINTKLFTARSTPAVYNITTGLIYWDIIKGATVYFKIPTLGLDGIKTIPNATSVLVTDLF